jgi:hypothetical protein
MRTDFHLAGIYALCARLGLNDGCKRIISFSSEHVDHAFKGETRDGITTAHGPIDSRNAVFEEGMQMWSAFHFLPGMQGNSFSEKMVCWPSIRFVTTKPADVSLSGPTGADLLIEWFLQQPFDPYLTGIVAHILADTWSHRQFNGLFSFANDIEVVDALSMHVVQERKSWLADLMDTSKNIVLRFLFIGHGEAETLPDIPTEKWTFKDRNNKQWARNNLTDSCQPAVEQLYGVFSQLISNNSELRERPAGEGIVEAVLKGLITDPSAPVAEADDNSVYSGSKTPDGLRLFHVAARKYRDFYREAILDPLMKHGYGEFRD